MKHFKRFAQILYRRISKCWNRDITYWEHLMNSIFPVSLDIRIDIEQTVISFMDTTMTVAYLRQRDIWITESMNAMTLPITTITQV